MGLHDYWLYILRLLLLRKPFFLWASGISTKKRNDNWFSFHRIASSSPLPFLLILKTQESRRKGFKGFVSIFIVCFLTFYMPKYNLLAYWFPCNSHRFVSISLLPFFNTHISLSISFFYIKWLKQNKIKKLKEKKKCVGEWEEIGMFQELPWSPSTFFLRIACDVTQTRSLLPFTFVSFYYFAITPPYKG